MSSFDMPLVPLLSKYNSSSYSCSEGLSSASIFISNKPCYCPGKLSLAISIICLIKISGVTIILLKGGCPIKSLKSYRSYKY
jgi:hypothetical protein